MRSFADWLTENYYGQVVEPYANDVYLQSRVRSKITAKENDIDLSDDKAEKNYLKNNRKKHSK
jgi:hypothetical protein